MDQDTGWETAGRGCVILILGLLALAIVLGLVLGRRNMKADDVKVGGVYAVMVSGVLAPVRIDSAGEGYFRRQLYGTNLRTNRSVGPFTAAKCRRPWSQEKPLVGGGEPAGAAPADPTGRPSGEGERQE